MRGGQILVPSVGIDNVLVPQKIRVGNDCCTVEYNHGLFKLLTFVLISLSFTSYFLKGYPKSRTGSRHFLMAVPESADIPKNSG